MSYFKVVKCRLLSKDFFTKKKKEALRAVEELIRVRPDPGRASISVSVLTAVRDRQTCEEVGQVE